MRAPDFWFHDSWLSRLLSPLSALWCWGAEYRQSGIETFRPGIPVICVGNIVTGGTGKTPVVLALAERLKNRSRKVHLLTRGYGGTDHGPTRVDPSKHTASQTGDEAQLLAEVAPTWVSRWRPDGAAAAVKGGADIIVMDDGFQNFTLSKDLSLIVIDGAVGFGNGRVMPAGPCREPVSAGLARAHAAIVIGNDIKSVEAQIAPIPILHASVVPDMAAYALKGQRVLAFAGIGRPQKFFDMLQFQIQAHVVESISYPDHYKYKPGDLETLIAQAAMLDAIPVTTKKDWVRIPPAFQAKIKTIDIALRFADEAQLDRLLDKVLGS